MWTLAPGDMRLTGTAASELPAGKTACHLPPSCNVTAFAGLSLFESEHLVSCPGYFTVALLCARMPGAVCMACHFLHMIFAFEQAGMLCRDRERDRYLDRERDRNRGRAAQQGRYGGRENAYDRNRDRNRAPDRRDDRRDDRRPREQVKTKEELVSFGCLQDCEGRLCMWSKCGRFVGELHYVMENSVVAWGRCEAETGNAGPRPALVTSVYFWCSSSDGTHACRRRRQGRKLSWQRRWSCLGGGA